MAWRAPSDEKGGREEERADKQVGGLDELNELLRKFQQELEKARKKLEEELKRIRQEMEKIQHT